MWRDNKLITDLFVKETDTHQYLHASSCHVSLCKRAIPYSQALRLNRICSEIEFFDQRCNELEKWLLQRGYSNRLVRQQILKARKFKRADLLHEKDREKRDPKVVLNLTYHPALSGLRKILSNIHILLTPNIDHKKVFEDVPIIGFKNGKSLKDILVRAKLPESSQGESKGCLGKKCKICPFVTSSTTFVKGEANQGEYKIRGGMKMNCNTTNVVYLVLCKTCSSQYVGSCTTSFRTRFNNYVSKHRKYLRGEFVEQKSFYDHFAQEDHKGKEDWNFTLIDHGVDYASVRRKEAYWQHELNSFAPNGLNERNVNLDFG